MVAVFIQKQSSFHLLLLLPSGVVLVCTVEAGHCHIHILATWGEQNEGKEVLSCEGQGSKMHRSLPLSLYWPDLSHVVQQMQGKLESIVFFSPKISIYIFFLFLKTHPPIYT